MFNPLFTMSYSCIGWEVNNYGSCDTAYRFSVRFGGKTFKLQHLRSSADDRTDVASLRVHKIFTHATVRVQSNPMQKVEKLWLNE